MSDTPEALPIPVDEPAAVLVPVDEAGTFLLLAQGRLPGMEISPLLFMPDEQRRGLETAVAASAGLTNLGAQVAQGVISAQGLVRLAPETIAAMQAGAHALNSGGWNLGTLVTQGGKFAHTVRWAPATSASAATTAATIGPALTLLAIQWQLGKIEKLARQNLEVSKEIRALLEVEHRWELESRLTVLRGKWKHAQELQAVPKALWDAVDKGIEADLEKHRGLAGEQVEGLVAKLRGLRTSKERRDFLIERGFAMVSHARALVETESALCVYAALEIGSLLDATDAPTIGYRERRLAEALDRWSAASQRFEELLTPLHAHLKLIAQCDKLSRLRAPGSRKAEHVSREIAARLAAHIEAWLPALADRPTAEPAWGWFGELTRDKHERSREQIRARLTWMLEPSETLLTVLCGSANAWNKRNGYAVITDKRILLCKDGDFDERAAIDQELPWNSVSSMLTLAKGPMGGPDLVLKCTDQPRQIQLRDYTNHDELRALLDRFVDAQLQLPARTTGANRAATAALPA